MFNGFSLNEAFFWGLMFGTFNQAGAILILTMLMRDEDRIKKRALELIHKCGLTPEKGE